METMVIVCDGTIITNKGMSSYAFPCLSQIADKYEIYFLVEMEKYEYIKSEVTDMMGMDYEERIVVSPVKMIRSDVVISVTGVGGSVRDIICDGSDSGWIDVVAAML